MIVINIIISIIIINFIFYYDDNARNQYIKILLSLMASLFIGFIVSENYNTTYNSIIYTILLSILYATAYIDLRERKILNISIILMNILTFIYIINDVIYKHDIVYKLAILLVAFIIMRLLNKFKQLGEGDIPILLNLIYILNLNFIIVIGFGTILTLFLAIYYKIKKMQYNELAFVPGLFIATLIFIGYNFPYKL
ncbi:hypothetical protein [Clostridium akagii]|uniref:hypothetical protein n=1 Tax=Clostridium akagii TaxID=91623 RepID=UPI00056BFD77|nr:hypothetical protein [Clostridium akagii]